MLESSAGNSAPLSDDCTELVVVLAVALVLTLADGAILVPAEHRLDDEDDGSRSDSCLASMAANNNFSSCSTSPVNATAEPSTGYKLLLLFIKSLALEWFELCACAFVTSADREAPEVLLVSTAENPREAAADFG